MVYGYPKMLWQKIKQLREIKGTEKLWTGGTEKEGDCNFK